jgi:transposase InsO family protein
MAASLPDPTMSFQRWPGRRRAAAENPGPAVHDDLCVVIDEDGRERHQVTASRPNHLWLTDITEHWTAEGKLYLCAVKDAFSGRIVGYSIDARMKASRAVRTTGNAVRMRADVAGCIVHPDRGSQSRGRKLRCELAAHNLVG